jgi:hypothetical protein
VCAFSAQFGLQLLAELSPPTREDHRLGATAHRFSDHGRADTLSATAHEYDFATKQFH